MILLGDKDTTEKVLLEFNDVFADIINGFLFDGNQMVSPDDLITTSPISMYKDNHSKLHQQERDICKTWKRPDVSFSIFGLENQTDICREMVARVIGYDGASYRSQYLKAESEKAKNDGTSATPHMFLPVITIVLYFGDKKWDAPTNLRDLVRIPEGLEEYFNDYHINIMEVAHMEESDLDKFHSDFRIVAEYFVKSRIYGDAYQPDVQTIRHVDEVLKLMEVLTKDTRWNAIPIKERKKEGVKMSSVLDYREAKGRAEGEAKGRAEGEAKGRAAQQKEFNEKAKEMQNAGSSAEEILAALLSAIPETTAPDFKTGRK